MTSDVRLLEGKQVSFTGRLASLTRTQAAELVRTHGGRFSNSVGRGTAFLVIGQDGWPLQKDGRISTKLRKARHLAQAGQHITVLSEDEWLAQLGLKAADGDRQVYSTDELSALLKVPGDRLRKWVKLGLIQPIKIKQGLSYFDFAQVSGARTLVELLRAGITLPRLRRSMHQLQGWLGNVNQSLLQLVALEQNGELLVRLNDGLVEPSGQRFFDFADHQAAPAVSLPESRPSAEDLFDQACALDDAGHKAHAIETYRRALQVGGPDATVCYNLANALYANGQVEAAIERFYQTVELKPEFAEAWNNLGVVLSESGRLDEAKAAFEHALSTVPPYLEGYFNLADLLEDSGDRTSARQHWLKYLSLCPPGPRQRYARKKAGRL